jgi:hypothetical protein
MRFKDLRFASRPLLEFRIIAVEVYWKSTISMLLNSAVFSRYPKGSFLLLLFIVGSNF